MSYFNDDQRDYMSYLGTLALEQKCWCGWNKLGDCDARLCEPVPITLRQRAPSVSLSLPSTALDALATPIRLAR
jgi:hypothetical protein